MKELSKQDKDEIDQLTQLQMCSHWRFGTGKKHWFITGEPAAEYFKNRLFNHFGGFTPRSLNS